MKAVWAKSTVPVYFALAIKDRSFEWLKQAPEQRDVVVLLETDPLRTEADSPATAPPQALHE